MSQRYRKHATSTGAVLSVTLDTGEAPKNNVEIFVKSDGIATFTISGSSDDTNFRKSTEINVIGPDFEKNHGFSNAYRYVKVETTNVANNEIEIVAG